MKRSLITLLFFLFALGDLLILNLSIVTSFLSWTFFEVNDGLSSRIYLLIFSDIVWFFLLLNINPYRVSGAAQVQTILKGHFSFVFVHILTVLSLILFFDKTYSPVQMLVLYLIFIPIASLWRLLFFYLIRTVKNQRSGIVPYIIVGRSELAQDVRRNFQFHPEYGYKFLGYADETLIHHDAIPFHNIQTFSIENKVQEIYCCLQDISQSELKKLIDFGLNHFIKVKLISGSREFYQKGIQMDRYGQIPVINVSAVPLDEPVNQVVKRIFDLTFTIVLSLTVLIWLIPIVMILIKLDSKGPAFYKQLRAGKGNKPFSCLKFRSMVIDNDKEFVQATRNDPRITRLGKFLRKSSLDEFPQFINVLKGDMSVIGPRPHPLKLNDEFAQKVRKFNSRHYVKPGVSGLAQCMGYRGETKNVLDMKHRIALDRFYVEHWSLLFDIRIIIKTLHSLIKSSDKAF